MPASVIAAALLLGALLVAAAISVRRTGRRVLAAFILAVAAVWNAAIVFAFMSPHNRHIIHLATHRESVVVNAVIGVTWLCGCVFAVVKWFRPR